LVEEGEPVTARARKTDDYSAFIERKLSTVPPTGFDPGDVESTLFPHQQDLVRWALRRGRSAIFAATGLGKSRIESEWARRVSHHTGGRVLILAPLAVAPQTVDEGASIGVPITLCRDAEDVRDGVNIINYDRLHRLDTSQFTGVVLDEASVIKHENSKTLAQLIAGFSRTPFKLSATATPAPNDYTELGTQAEFLGVCTRTEMLSEFFVHDGGDTQSWRLKGHARTAFWRWVATWGALVRAPSDLGYPDEGYALPPLHVEQHVLPATVEEARAAGKLFVDEAGGLAERRAARKASIGRRVDECARIVNEKPDEQWLVWCDLNAESEALVAAIDGAVEVSGSDDTETKESRLHGFARGEHRVLVSKPSICGFGLNFQRCSHMAFVGVTDSWESYYQAVRRCWRFRQTRPVYVHIFASEAEGSVVANLQRKEADAHRMSEELSNETRDVVRAAVRGLRRTVNEYSPTTPMHTPSWLQPRKDLSK
jgi:superfamily II DNA or RNA helicase